MILTKKKNACKIIIYCKTIQPQVDPFLNLHFYLKYISYHLEHITYFEIKLFCLLFDFWVGGGEALLSSSEIFFSNTVKCFSLVIFSIEQKKITNAPGIQQSNFLKSKFPGVKAMIFNIFIQREEREEVFDILY